MTVLTHQAQNTGSSITSTTTLAIAGLSVAVPIGDTVFVVVVGTAASATCADNSANAGTANVWTQDSTGTSATSRIWVFRSNITRSLSTGNTITITFATATSRKSGVVFSTHGWVTPAAVERSATASGTTSPMSTGTTTATTKPDEFVLAAYGITTSGTTPTVTDTSGMARGAIGVATLTGLSKCATYSWKETSATGTQAGSATVSPVTDWVGLILTYPAVAGTVFAKTITGSTIFSGISPRPKVAVQHKSVGSASFVGMRFATPTARLLSAALAPVGVLGRQLSLLRSLAGALSFAGSTSPATLRVRALVGAGFAPTGSLTRVKAVSKAISGALSFVGSQSHTSGKVNAAGFAPTGALSEQQSLGRVLSGALSFAGSMNRLTSHKLSAAIETFAGMVAAAQRPPFTATLHPTGVVTHGVPQRTLFASLSFDGNETIRSTTRLLVSSLIAAGVMHTQYLPPVGPTPVGGGGFGALMDDSFFQRYKVARAWRGVKRVKV